MRARWSGLSRRLPARRHLLPLLQRAVPTGWNLRHAAAAAVRSGWRRLSGRVHARQRLRRLL
jgi:hypothetical protein